MSNKTNKNSDKSSEIKSIKYGIIFQKSTLIKISEIFKFYFSKSNPNIIKNLENEYEFTLEKDESLHFIFRVINENDMKNITQIYKTLNFFLIFIDVQSTASLKFLENSIDKLIACNEDITKKCYIFGAYRDNNLIVNKDEKISTILNCKGIDYEYSEINIDKDEDFPKGMEYIIDDSKEMMEEMKFEEIRNDMEKNKQRSCLII